MQACCSGLKQDNGNGMMMLISPNIQWRDYDMNDLREELRRMRVELDLTQKVYCAGEEEKKLRKMMKEKFPLPDGIKVDEHNFFYRYIDTDLSEQEIKQLFLYRQTAYLRSIKNSMVFFVVIATASLIVSLIIAIS